MQLRSLDLHWVFRIHIPLSGTSYVLLVASSGHRVVLSNWEAGSLLSSPTLILGSDRWGGHFLVLELIVSIINNMAFDPTCICSYADTRTNRYSGHTMIEYHNGAMQLTREMACANS